jgi:hypothetical protein
MLELDHVFCFVPPDGDWADRLAVAGWSLDAGTAHEGQGTRNRRLVFARQFLELVWVTDAAEARDNPLHLDRRADWQTTRASPFGFGFRGLLDDADRAQFWPYDALGIRIWVHHDNDRAPERPLVFVLEVDLAGRLPAGPVASDGRAELVAVQHTGPASAALPAYVGPPVRFGAGEHRLEVLLDRGAPMILTPILAVARSR